MGGVSGKPVWAPLAKPVIYLPRESKQKLDAYVSIAKGEIAGMGRISMLGPSRFLVEDVFIFKQKANGAEAVLDQEDLSAFLVECVQKGISIDNIRLQWHSHVNMGCFWSATDLANIEGFDNGMVDWMVSIVGSKSGQYLGRLDVFHPLRISVDDIPVLLLEEIDPKVAEQIEREIEEKVGFLPPKVVYVQGQGMIPVEGDEDAYSQFTS